MEAGRVRALFLFSQACEEDAPLGDPVENKTCYVAVYIASKMKDQGRVIQVEFVGQYRA